MGCTSSKQDDTKPVPPADTTAPPQTIIVVQRANRASLQSRPVTQPLSLAPVGRSDSGDELYVIDNKSDQYHIIVDKAKVADVEPPQLITTTHDDDDDEVIQLDDDAATNSQHKHMTQNNTADTQYTPVMVS